MNIRLAKAHFNT